MNVKVTSSVELLTPVLKKVDAKSAQALAMTGAALQTEVIQAQVIPFDSGALQNSTRVNTATSKSGKVSIASSTPYARRLYFHPEYNFQKGNNPNAKGKWFEDWAPGGAKESFVPNAYQRFLRMLIGG